MATETVVETVVQTEVIHETDGSETVIETTHLTDIVTESLGPRGTSGAQANEEAIRDVVTAELAATNLFNIETFQDAP